jgi:hypothetical protein
MLSGVWHCAFLSWEPIEERKRLVAKLLKG